MLEKPSPDTMSGAGNPQEGYYCHDVHCSNCRRIMHVHVRRGVVQIQSCVECAHCGVQINLHTGDVKS